MSELTPREILDAFDAGLADAARYASQTQQQSRGAKTVGEIVPRRKDTRAGASSPTSAANSFKDHAR